MLPMSRQGWLALVSSLVPCLFICTFMAHPIFGCGLFLLCPLVVFCIHCLSHVLNSHGRITFFVALSSLPPLALVLLGGFSRWAHCVGSFVCKVSFSLLDCSPFAYHWLAFTLPEPLLLEFFRLPPKKEKIYMYLFKLIN